MATKPKPAKHPPPSHTPLAALPAVALDLETTGLDVRTGRVVQVAAIPLRGGRVLSEPPLDHLVNPGMPIPEDAARIHGIRDADVAGAPALRDLFKPLCAAIQGRVVIGHHIGFDLAILRHEAARLGVPWQEPPSLDIAVLVGALDPWLPDLGLETIANNFGIAITGRHSALGDATAAARVLAALLPRLREKDIRTLAEAQALAARRGDLTLRQAEAGWHAVPDGLDIPRQDAPSARIDGYVFERRLRDVMHAPVLFTAPDATLRQAALTMIENRVGALLVGTPAAPPAGIVTERDLLRAGAGAGADFDSIRVRQVMSAPVASMDGDEMLYRGLARMDRHGIRHLPVADERGIVLGMVSQRDLLHHRASSALVLDDALHDSHDPAQLAAAFGRVPQVAAHLLDEGLSGLDIARVISTELREVSARAAEMAAAALKAEGLGEAPAPWCLLVLGSAGRGESLLGADQDNALIHAGRDADDPWFAQFGARIAAYLDEAGVPRCKGGVMAANPVWRGTREGWRTRVETWLSRAKPEDLLNVDIFFDLTPVACEADLGHDLHVAAVEAASRSTPFLSLLAQTAETLAPRLGLFGMPRIEDGRFELKRDGLLPIVTFARMIALKIASTARATPDRLHEAAAAGRVAEGDTEAMIETHAFVLGLILRQQIIDLDQGVPPSNRVASAILTKADRRRLKNGLGRVDGIVREARSLMAGR